MNTAFYISALVVGFLGSFHCAGMCGPIALMLPPGKNILVGRLIYNSGRILTYVLLGMTFGLLGVAAAIKGLQREFSVATGVLILITVIFNSINRNWLEGRASNFIGAGIRNGLKNLFAKKTFASFFFIGMLNGLLPCGFVYLAVAGAASAGSMGGGMIYMTLFGLGTFPMMMLISVAVNFFNARLRNLFSKATVPLALILGVFLIYRGTVMSTSHGHEHKNTAEMLMCPVPGDRINH